MPVFAALGRNICYFGLLRFLCQILKVSYGGLFSWQPEIHSITSVASAAAPLRFLRQSVIIRELQSLFGATALHITEIGNAL